MTADVRLQSLENKHRQLEEELHNEEKSPAADENKIRILKREKLKLKDEMTALKERVA